MSGRGLGKLCERYGIPVPPRGYWAKKAAGKRVFRPPLIEIEAGSGSGSEISITVKPRSEGQAGSPGVATEAVADPFKELWEGLIAEARPVRVPATLSSPHRIVAACIEEDRQRSRSFGPTWSTDRSRRNQPLEKRRLRILSTLLKELEDAIRGKQQMPAVAIVHRYAELGHPAPDVLALLRRYVISEDGALHAEKYYRTTTEEFNRTRLSLRWQHLVALARVTASSFGKPAPGVAQARELLKV